MTSGDENVNKPEDEALRGELLLELLSEEIPARMQRRAIEDLTELLRHKLAAAEIAPENLRGYVTPRRLVVIAEGVPRTQPDRTEERRGPRVGAPQPAIDGFLRSAGLALIEECEVRDTGRGEFYFANIQRSGRPSTAVLPELIKTAITELPWPKSMRWPAAELRWVRPLSSIICVYDGEILPLAIDGVSVGRTTRGHRFLSPGAFCVSTAAEYLEKLQHTYVILDQDQRRELIRNDLDRYAAELGVMVKPDPGLLDEVTGLAEFPVVLAGAIDPDFIALPPEVLQTAMRTHQKYFSYAYADGRPAPHFLFVANNLPEDGGSAIVAGNERVLRARLADARFFWDQDRKVPLESRVEALKDRVYHAKLGSVYDKVARIEQLAAFLAEQLYPMTPAPTLPFPASGGGFGKREARIGSPSLAQPGANGPSNVSMDSRFRGNGEGELSQLAQRAAHLAKADLSSAMVGEFPELQGVMGQYYARDEEDGRVADAIAAHYKPLGPTDACPTAPVSVVVALADKVETLAAFFSIGERPTGSRDPFALRRAGLGIIRLILANSLKLPLLNIFTEIAKLFVNGEKAASLANELLDFVLDRLNIYLRAEGFSYDVIAASLYAGDLPAAPPERTKERVEDDLTRLVVRADALRSFLSSDDGVALLTAYRRASNIVAIEERRDGQEYDGSVDRAALQSVEEAELFERLTAINMASALLAEENFRRAMGRLATLRGPVDAFFEKVTVNTDETVTVDGVEKKLRENRLRLLARIRDTMNQVADFSQIEG